MPVDPGEKLSTGLAVPEVKLAVPVEMIEDAGLELDHLARGSDGIVQHQRSLWPQAGQTGSCRQTRSTRVAEGRFCVAARQSSVQVPPARAITG